MASRPRAVVWTVPAREGLDEVLAYVAQDSSAAAADLLQVALAASDSLGTLSHRGRVVPEIGDPDVREIFVYSYRLIYEVSETRVAVLAFVHGARDFGRWLRGE